MRAPEHWGEFVSAVYYMQWDYSKNEFKSHQPLKELLDMLSLPSYFAVPPLHPDFAARGVRGRCLSGETGMGQ